MVLPLFSIAAVIILMNAAIKPDSALFTSALFHNLLRTINNDTQNV